MKASLRKKLKLARRSFSASDHTHRSTLAASAITRMPAFKSGSRVALYLPFDRETDTAALLIAARRRGIRVYVPVVIDVRHRRLRFHRLTGKTRRGIFGIAVPQRVSLRVPPRASHSGAQHSGPRGYGPVAPRWFDLIVVPLVGIDGMGRRLGMGGGFYDRALEFRRTRRQWLGPRLVGLAFDCQRTADVFADAWDVRLDSLATESGIENFSKERR